MSNIRFYSLTFFLVLIFILFEVRSFQLAVYSPLPQRFKKREAPIRRGSIYDSKDNVLAVSLDTMSIAANPLEIVDIELTSAQISKIIGLDKTDIKNKILKNKNKSYFYIKRKVHFDIANKLRRLKLPGLRFEKEAARYYPNNSLASTLLGFVGVDNEGLSGLEYYYNEVLTNDQKGFFVGNNIHLSINAMIQLRLEGILKSKMLLSKAKSAVGIISEVKTGKIISMASLPDFNPNNAYKFPKSNWINKAISSIYEPGSTFKLFTMSALDDDTLYDDSKTYFCPGYFEYQGKRLGCPAKHGTLNLMGVFKKSCNTGVITSSWNVAVNTLYKNFSALGFGHSTGIKLPAEQKGILKDSNQWDVYLKMSIPIGHGIAVTPIQMTMAANALVNGGYLLKPSLVDKITTPTDQIIEKNTVPIIRKLDISQQKRNRLLTMLKEVVKSGGTGHLANLASQGLSVCGKTGTSIKLKKDGSGYTQGKNRKYQASFLGFYPCENPKISILILFDEPQGAYRYGGSIAAPAFHDTIIAILPFLKSEDAYNLRRLSKLHRKDPTEDTSIMPQFIGLSKKQVLLKLNNAFPGNHKFIGTGYLTQQRPLANTKIKKPYLFEFYFQEPDNHP